MKILITEDDFTSRFLLQQLLKDYGTTYIACNGKEAVEAVQHALDIGDPYDLVCLDIVMPEMDGHDALRQIRGIEEARGITSTYGAKVLMTTALNDPKNVFKSYMNLCHSYLLKPYAKAKLEEELHNFGFIF